MKPSSLSFLLLPIRLVSAQWFGGGGPGRPGGFGGYEPGCIQSCLSSLYPTPTSAWSAFCASGTPSAVPSCLSISCGAPTYTSGWASQTALCSAWSSCSSASGTGCSPYWANFNPTAVPSQWSSGWNGGGNWGGWGGYNSDHSWYTVTGSGTITHGWVTQTVIVTTTTIEPGGVTSAGLVTATRTGTIIAAAAVSETPAPISTTTAPTVTATPSSATLQAGGSISFVGMLLGVALTVVLLL